MRTPDANPGKAEIKPTASLLKPANLKRARSRLLNSEPGRVATLPNPDKTKTPFEKLNKEQRAPNNH
jgi:hypothetical protein